MTKPTIRISKNIWGNYVCFIGKERVYECGDSFSAKLWLAEKVLSGLYKVSPKSDYQETDVEEFKKFI